MHKLFAKSSTLASSGVKENAFPNNMMVLLWEIILNNIIIITHDGIVNYSVKGLGCNLTLIVCWQKD